MANVITKIFGSKHDRDRKRIQPIVDEINEIYEEGLRAGAIGGKLLGAGGGGFMLFFCRPEDQEKIKEKLKNLLHVPFYFEHLGSQIIYYSHQ